MAEEYAAHDLSEKALGGPIGIRDDHFVDAYGRRLELRGLNVSGSSKLPTTPNGLSHLTDGFYEHRTVSFIGRPFPLEEAPLHFARLRAWGLPLIRLLVTWESLGHAGPNPQTDLDLEYIAYLRQLIELMGEYGLKCFICAHQDVWSRFSGGSGAPGWTFEAAGLDVEAFSENGLAYVHGQDEARRAREPVDPREPSGPFLWPSGYQKLAASTLATLFWAGDALAPKLRCLRASPAGQGPPHEVSIKEFLQGACVEAFGRLADEVGHLEACLGFEPMNEPHRGLINLHDFHAWDYNTDLHIGHCPSLAQSLALGSGYAQRVPFYVKSWPFPTRKSHTSLVDPKGRSAWLPPRAEDVVDRPHGMGECVWRAHDVWRWDEAKGCPVILEKNYFEHDHRPGRESRTIEWYRDCWAPFLARFSERTSRRFPRHLSFIEPIPNEYMPPWETEQSGPLQPQKYATQTVIDAPRPQNLVFAPHFYDLNVLFSKSHGLLNVDVQGLSRGMFILKALYFGEEGLHRNYRKQVGNLVKHGQLSLGRLPTLIGEVGISFDINDRRALATGDYDKQRELMHALIAAMEFHRVGFTLWNYNPANRSEYGDGWNKEDFSIVNGDEAHVSPPDYRNRAREADPLYRGGRTLDVIIRPYAAKIAGRPLQSTWDPRTLRFVFIWRSDDDDEGEEKKKKTTTTGGAPKDPRARTTEIFLPEYHYGDDDELDIKLNHGRWRRDRAKQTLYITADADADGSGSGGAWQYELVVQLRDVDAHLRRRIAERRAAFPPTGPFQTRVPPAVEAWLETLTFRQVSQALLLLLAVVVGLVAVALRPT